MTVATEPIALAPGGTAILAARLRIEPGFHIQSHTPSKPSYVRTEITIDGAAGLVVGEPRFPPAHPFILGADAIDVHDGTVLVQIPVQAIASAVPGEHALGGSVRYQACDRRHCLFPRVEPFVARVRITGE